MNNAEKLIPDLTTARTIATIFFIISLQIGVPKLTVHAECSDGIYEEMTTEADTEVFNTSVSFNNQELVLSSESSSGVNTEASELEYYDFQSSESLSSSSVCENEILYDTARTVPVETLDNSNGWLQTHEITSDYELTAMAKDDETPTYENEVQLSETIVENFECIVPVIDVLDGNTVISGKSIIEEYYAEEDHGCSFDQYGELLIQTDSSSDIDFASDEILSITYDDSDPEEPYPDYSSEDMFISIVSDKTNEIANSYPNSTDEFSDDYESNILTSDTSDKDSAFYTCVDESSANDSFDDSEKDTNVEKDTHLEVTAKVSNAAKNGGYTGWRTVGNKSFWYENGVKQGTEGRGKEIYDPASDAWYWLDAVQDGAKAVNKEVYMPYTINGKDSVGKWVRFDSDGHMIKGWYDTEGKTYFYDYGTGAMAKGRVSVNRLPCWFDDKTGVGRNRVWEKQNNQNAFWYENGRRQGYDPTNSEYRGREIYDPSSNAWYWLDSCYQGKRAAGKEVYIPYTIQGQDNTGKWVRYDYDGRMIKGWFTVDGADIFDTPQLAGNRYYYNDITGAMHKGRLDTDGQIFFFDDVSGTLNAHSHDVNLTNHIPDKVINVKSFGAVSGDSKDDTIAIRKAIDAVSSSSRTVYIPAGQYVIDATIGLYLKSNMNLIMDRNAVLEVKGNGSESYNVIGLRKLNYVNIFGGKILGERGRHTGNSGESGVGIGVYDSSNVTIAYTDVSSNWGDGIYLGSEGYWYDKHGAKDVTIRGCYVHDNRRSNISIVDAENVTIDSCSIANAKGTAPQCGINVEPHAENGKIPADRKCEHLTIKHTTIDTMGEGDPSGQFFTFMTIHNPYDKTYISSDDILIDDCIFNGDCGNYSGTNCRISNTVIKNIFYDRQNTRLTNVKYRMIWKHEVS